MLKDWKLGRLNHVAIAVPNLEKAAALYRDVFGAEVSKIVVRQFQMENYNVCACTYTHTHSISLLKNMASTLYL